ncbi:hypothetical protein KY347_05370 [Candidatus Woesearchaeota archaeon]|nr:hypothetical protein [Candidatus Woesearchaeota archaeon]
MQLKELKQQYVEAVYETKSLLIKEQPFDLKSGGKSHIYLNHRNFLSDYRYLGLVANIYLKVLEKKVKGYKLCAVDSVMSPIITGAMSILGKKDVVMVKGKKLEHGTKEDIYGEICGEVVIIDDMSSTGGTLIEAAKKLRENGGLVNYAVVSACRDETAEKNLGKEGIELLSIAGFKEIIELLMPRLTAKEKDLVRREYGG